MKSNRKCCHFDWIDVVTFENELDLLYKIILQIYNMSFCLKSTQIKPQFIWILREPTNCRLYSGSRVPAESNQRVDLNLNIPKAPNQRSGDVLSPIKI